MKNLLKLVSITFVSVLLISSAVFSQSSGTMSSSSNDVDFPQKAYSGGMMEVQLGKIAQQKASSYKVKEFGERMINDHSKANKELKDIAQKNNISLPDSMLDENKDTYDNLSQYSGSEFDKHYMDKMVADHKATIKLFENASQNAKNPEIQQWAKDTLPTLKQHLQLAESTLADLNQTK